MFSSQLQKINNHLRETCKNKFIVAAMFLILLSLLFLLTMLIGGAVGSVDLNTFTFDEPVSKILQRKSIKFTLLGYCIDDQCTKHVSHDFDKAPTSDEIQSGEVKKRSIDQIKNSKYDLLEINPGDIGKKAGDAANDAGKKAGEIANDAGKKAGEIADDTGKKVGEIADSASQAVVSALLSAFNNFIPKEPTNGKSGWIARPIIAATVFNTLALLLLIINKKYCYPSAIFLVLLSFLLNAVSFFITFSLFSLVFNVIGAFPGGDNKTGSAIHLSAMSSIFLLVALSLIIVGISKKKTKKDSEPV